MIRMKRTLAFVLSAMLCFGAVPMQPVHAQESETVQGEGSDLLTSDSKSSNSELNETQGGENEVKQKPEVKYVFVNSPEISSFEEQNIVVGWDESAGSIEAMTLKVEDEESYVSTLYPSNRNGNTFLFSEIFETGGYRLTGATVTTEDETFEVDFSDAGVEAYFGVDKEYAEDYKSEHFQMEPVASEDQLASSMTGVVSGDDAQPENVEENIDQAFNEQVMPTTFGLNPETYGVKGKLVIVLDPGHDSSHGGARANNVKEEEAVLEIAKYCRDELSTYHDVIVYMTRETAECPFPETIGVKGGNIIDIQKRVEWAASKGADAFVSFHLNSANSSKARGAEVYYHSQNSDGKELAQEIENELASLGLYERGIKINDDYAVVSASQEHGFPGIIIEHAFLTNQGDVNGCLNTDSGLKMLGIADANGIAAHYGLSKDGSSGWQEDSKGFKYCKNGEYIKNQWADIYGGHFYFDEEGYRCTGWKTIDGKRFYFDQDGIMNTGWQLVDGKWYYLNYYDGAVTGWLYLSDGWYYLDNTGAMQTGWINLNGKVSYCQDSGRMVKGWQDIDGKTYYFDASGYMVKGKQTIDGLEYVFDEKTGVLTSEKGTKPHDAGWAYENKIWYYYNTEGKKLTGWNWIDSTWYYMNSKGEMQTGWLEEGKNKFFLSSSGAMCTGWQNINGSWYYMNESGYMLRGWQYIGGYWSYLDENGKMLKGWQKIDGYWYYLDGSGYLLRGWQYIGSHWFYMNERGEMLTSWQYIDGYWYYMDGNGYMLKGWQKIDGYWYYLDGSGCLVRDWLYLNGTYYFLDRNSGIMQIGLHWIDGSYYYFDPSGAMVDNPNLNKNGWFYEDGYWYYYSTGKKLTGWEYIDGHWFYMNGRGEMLTGWQYIDGYWFYMNGSGYMLRGWQYIGSHWFYMNERGEMLRGWQYINGAWYYMNESGYMLRDWQYIDGSWYYLNESGEALKGWQVIDGEKFYFDSNRALCRGWLEIGMRRYYMDDITGAMYTGRHMIGKESYYFDLEKGFVTDDPLVEKHTVLGTSTVTEEMLVNYYNSKNKTYPKEKLEVGGAPTINDFAKIVIEEATAENVKPELVFCQAMKETGWFKFGGSVKIEQFNFSGIGAVDASAEGADFSVYGKDGVRMGIRAQVQHLKAYADPTITSEGLKHECVDPRFKYVTKGCAEYIEWLGAKENPNETGWATSADYGRSILKMMDDLEKNF